MAEAIIAPPVPVNLPRVIACSSAGAPVYGGVGATSKTLATTVIKGGAVAPSSLLEITGFVEFVGNNTSRVITVALGDLTIADTFPDVGINCLQFQSLLWINATATSIRVMDIRLNGTIQPHRAVSASPLGISDGTAFSTNLSAITAGASYAQADMTAVKENFAKIAARTLGNGSVFRGDNAAKTAYAVDLTADVTLTIAATPASGDTAELIGFTVVNYAEASLPKRSNAPANALACFGDSLTAGTGSSSPAGGWPSQLRIAEAGRAVANYGVGGETSSQIIDRFVADKVRSKYWNAVLWIGRNDVGVASNLTTTVMAQLARAMAVRASGVKTVICTITPASTEDDATANGIAIANCNTAIKALYGNRTAEGIAICDTYTVLTTDPGHLIPSAWRSDPVHLNDPGYGQVQTAVSAALATVSG